MIYNKILLQFLPIYSFKFPTNLRDPLCDLGVSS